jgi:hypothetical protein
MTLANLVRTLWIITAVVFVGSPFAFVLAECWNPQRSVNSLVDWFLAVLASFFCAVPAVIPALVASLAVKAKPHLKNRLVNPILLVLVLTVVGVPLGVVAVMTVAQIATLGHGTDAAISAISFGVIIGGITGLIAGTVLGIFGFKRVIGKNKPLSAGRATK